LTDLHITPTSLPMLWCDNLGATYLFDNSIFHARSKHVEVDYQFVCNRLSRRIFRFASFSLRINLQIFLLSYFLLLLSICKSFKLVSFVHVLRERNGMADSLAKHARSI
jgi:hypothetical protein